MSNPRARAGHAGIDDSLVPLDDAIRTVVASAWTLPTESIALHHALHRCLAEDVCADGDIPPFDKGMVDGYACRRADLPGPLRLAGSEAAGEHWQAPLEPGGCLRIMTGAPVPSGADCVVMQELAHPNGDGTIAFDAAATATASNVVPRGEDIKEGALVVRAGTRLLAPHLAALASVGCTEPMVHRAPRVGVLATGNELVPASKRPRIAQIRETNTYPLLAQLATSGAYAEGLGIVRDDPEAITQALADAMREHDIVITTGGVSVGDHDHVPAIAEALRLDIRLRRVAIQPGKPVLFALGERHALFGLSGNPVSSFVQFELLVKPLLYRIQRAQYAPTRFWVPLATRKMRSSSDRTLLFPVSITDAGAALPVEYHGSAHIHAYTEAHGMAHFPIGKPLLEAGEPVEVQLIA